MQKLQEMLTNVLSPVTIRGRGFILRAEERADNIFAAIDATVDKMTRQIERFKGKHWRRREDGQAKEQIGANEAVDIEDTVDPVIVRRKSFILTPMDELEALEQLMLLGHEDFFVFYNATTEKINVLYRRRDGSYGLIDPIIG